jgi:competence protein ComEC
MVLFLLAVLSIQLWQISSAIRLNSREEVWLMHLTRNTLLLHQDGNRLTVMTPSPRNAVGLVSNFKVGEAIRKIKYLPLATKYEWGNGELYIMGEKGDYPQKSGKAQYLLLRSSPKINLDRVLDKVAPATVIADGSNYPSFISRWRNSCSLRGIPFHNTATDGAYRLPVN